MGKKRTKPKIKNYKTKAADQMEEFFVKEIAKHSTMQAVNDNVLVPFISAFEKIAEERRYTINIFGRRSNLVFSTEEAAESIFEMIENYLEEEVSHEDC